MLTGVHGDGEMGVNRVSMEAGSRMRAAVSRTRSLHVAANLRLIPVLNLDVTQAGTV
jgi:hypothetical protein